MPNDKNKGEDATSTDTPDYAGIFSSVFAVAKVQNKVRREALAAAEQERSEAVRANDAANEDARKALTEAKRAADRAYEEESENINAAYREADAAIYAVYEERVAAARKEATEVIKRATGGDS